MARSVESFLRRLESGRAWSLIYRDENRQGLVAVWKHETLFILTREECFDGDQYNESQYTRDERHEFPSWNDLLCFIQQSNWDLDQFTP